MKADTIPKPIRVGVFTKVSRAEQAVQHLLAAGFPKKDLAVICSDKHKERFFSYVPTPEASNMKPAESVIAGGAIGAALSGLAVVATTLATGGIALLIAGPALVGAGALAGSFTGLMVARGLEPDVADYYDQAVEQGKILVVVEVHGDESAPSLETAERIFAEAGAEPVALAG